MKKFVVFHDYGTEGWVIHSEHDDILSAVRSREDDIRNGGGTSLIFEAVPLLEAYRRADYEQGREVEKQALQAQKA